jgi:hypothetical protein
MNTLGGHRGSGDGNLITEDGTREGRVPSDSSRDSAKEMEVEKMKAKSLLLVPVLLLAFYTDGVWASVPLPSTGVGGVGTVDTNYALRYVVNLGDTPVTWTAYATANQAPGLWVEAPDGAEWITPITIYPDISYYFFYELSVAIPGVVSISGRWATDNNGEIFLNGTSTGITKNIVGFLTLDSFTITGDFTGNDTLTFRVWQDGSSPTGLLVTDLTVELVPLGASVNIDPDTLNLKSSGKWITAYIEPPDGYDVQDIDIDSIRLEGLLDVQRSEIQGSVLMVKFDREAVVDYLEDILEVAPPADVTLTVTGELGDGTEFTGDDTIRVINPGERT